MGTRTMPLKRSVRIAKYHPAMIDLVYPGLAKGTRLVVATIEDPAYNGRVLGLEYGSIIAWVYEKDTVG